MQYSEAKIGRVFVMRLEDGERLPETIESFAREHQVESGMVILIGGVGDGSRMVVGPERESGRGVVPLVHVLTGIQEILAVGTLFPDESGNPMLHMHGATGREGGAAVGCTRAGMEVWLVGEVILLEMVGSGGVRRKDPGTGFQLLGF
ncbi:MAG: PPC domain-containing DNA-binding protein [Syntrophobacteraceae bacterium]